MTQGVIFKALSGFYYVESAGSIYTCRARGKFRRQGLTPLVGDRVRLSELGESQGTLEEILPRDNCFQRPAVANMDQMVLIASLAIPVTDPFLLDRLASLALFRHCACIVVVNKCDLVPGDPLEAIYRQAGIPVLQVSARTGQGIEDLRELLTGKTSVFTGNSGVGKSSLLNALAPQTPRKTGEVSEKLGRGRHTTRHVELFPLPGGGLVADTPGFSAFDTERLEGMRPGELPETFPEFRPYLGQCRFPDCSHGKEAGCAVRQAVKEGKIPASRHKSYVRLLEQLRSVPEWQSKKTDPL